MAWKDVILKQLNSASAPDTPEVHELRRMVVAANEALDRGDMAAATVLKTGIQALLAAAAQYHQAAGKAALDVSHDMSKLDRLWSERYPDCETLGDVLTAATDANDAEVLGLLDQIQQGMEREAALDRSQP